MPHSYDNPEPEAEPQQETGGDCQTRPVRLFRNDNEFEGGQYTAEGIELNLPCGKLRIGRMIMLPPTKLPSIAYIGRRNTWTWTIRVWTVAISFKPN